MKRWISHRLRDFSLRFNARRDTVNIPAGGLATEMTTSRILAFMHSGKKTPQAAKTARTNWVSRPESLEPRRLLSGCADAVAMPNVAVTPPVTSAPVQGFTPTQIRDAYGFNQNAGTGKGQTIAIVDAYNDSKIASDLAV